MCLKKRWHVGAITVRDRGRSVGSLVRELNDYIRGWWAYFRLGNSQNLTRPLNDWILRRLRAYVWTQWRLPRTKVRHLLARGVHRNWAFTLGNTRKGAWRISKQSPVVAALPEHYFTQKLAWCSSDSYCLETAESPDTRSVRPVVWAFYYPQLECPHRHPFLKMAILVSMIC
jgi:hypothetical protein